MCQTCETLSYLSQVVAMGVLLVSHIHFHALTCNQQQNAAGPFMCQCGSPGLQLPREVLQLQLSEPAYQG